MSSGKLDQSLDEILVNRRQTTRQSARRRANRRAATKRATVGGVKKNTKAAKAAGKGVQGGPSAPPTESKIIVSGLPSDVNEANIKVSVAVSAFETFEAQLLLAFRLSFRTMVVRLARTASSFVTFLRALQHDANREKLSSVLSCEA
ncbi:RNA annealing protein [Aspergillus sclerotialis]|uniref:RNA annealing protein n=1 Tax=Aspergillus sclerotialis TaxID=2070753 RepID=A0A3A3A856_9EURO|nr:RNA annealing protein [Aspergillus sclerotialis]